MIPEDLVYRVVLRITKWVVVREEFVKLSIGNIIHN